jgi:hypothetical protein
MRGRRGMRSRWHERRVESTVGFPVYNRGRRGLLDDLLSDGSTSDRGAARQLGAPRAVAGRMAWRLAVSARPGPRRYLDLSRLCGLRSESAARRALSPDEGPHTRVSLGAKFSTQRVGLRAAAAGTGSTDAPSSVPERGLRMQLARSGLGGDTNRPPRDRPRRGPRGCFCDGLLADRARTRRTSRKEEGAGLGGLACLRAPRNSSSSDETCLSVPAGENRRRGTNGSATRAEEAIRPLRRTMPRDIAAVVTRQKFSPIPQMPYEPPHH